MRGGRLYRWAPAVSARDARLTDDVSPLRWKLIEQSAVTSRTHLRQHLLADPLINIIKDFKENTIVKHDLGSAFIYKFFCFLNNYR